jgi:hypothetical protein
VIGALVAAAVLLAAVGAWMLRPRRRPAAEPWESGRPEPPDRAELEAAEREVRERPAALPPDEELPGDDWGPGVPR